MNDPERHDSARKDGFDFTARMRRLCRAVVLRVPQFYRIDLDRVAIRYCQTRKGVPYGMQASLTPMRFEGGALYEKRGGQTWTVERLVDREGREMLYLLSFYLPRFLDLSLHEKLVTVFHELWHIGPRFDGDLRRLPGRCHVHSRSEREYDDAMAVLVDRWLAVDPPAQTYDFLHCNFRQLQKEYGTVFGLKIPTPKLLPVDCRAA